MTREQAECARDGPEQATEPASASDSDAELLARVAAGDAEALAALYARHQWSLRAYVGLLTADRGLAEEVLQDTLLAVWKGAGGYAGQASVRAWLLGIARRRALAELRRHTWHIVPADEVGPEGVPLAPDPADVAMAAAERAELEEAISRLSPAQREVLTLIFVHELSYRELADVLAVPVGTVKSRLNAARHALRAILEVSPILVAALTATLI